jgi:phage terminase large subunit
MIEPTFFIQHIPQPRIVAPVRYPHIWEGAYATAFEGAYFAKHLEQARQQGRIGHVAVDPILPVKAFMDIGGAGHSSDAMGIWLTQFAGREIRLLDYIEGIGQPLAYYAGELRRRGWKEAIVCPAARRRCS